MQQPEVGGDGAWPVCICIASTNSKQQKAKCPFDKSEENRNFRRSSVSRQDLSEGLAEEMLDFLEEYFMLKTMS